MAYATLDDLTAFWRTLSPAEETRAEKLLEFASIMIDSHCKKPEPNTAMFICCDLVKTAMQTGDFSAPVTQATTSAGNYSSTMLFANPTGDMYWKKQYSRMLGVSGMGLASISPKIKENTDGELEQ